MPMGSLLSPILANIILQDLEHEIFTTNCYAFLFPICRLHIILCAQSDKVDTILKLFNSYHERIKFTIDYGDENSISFLDVKLMKQDEKIIFNTYKKPTDSGRYLNSNHLKWCTKEK